MSLAGDIHYIFAHPRAQRELDTGTVFYKVRRADVAERICSLFQESGSEEMLGLAAAVAPASNFTENEQILLDEALQVLETYSDPDPWIHDPPPPRSLHRRAMLAVQADDWEEIVRTRLAEAQPYRHAPDAAAPKGESVYAASGKKWAISREFDAVVNMTTQARTTFTSPRAREALRALVENGSFDREHALTKKVLCEAVYQRVKAKDRWPQSYKPIQFFRVRQKGKTVLLPIYEQIIRTDGHGYY